VDAGQDEEAREDISGAAQSGVTGAGWLWLTKKRGQCLHWWTKTAHPPALAQAEGDIFQPDDEFRLNTGRKTVVYYWHGEVCSQLKTTF
jgi:superoxide dismutase